VSSFERGASPHSHPQGAIGDRLAGVEQAQRQLRYREARQTELGPFLTEHEHLKIDLEVAEADFERERTRATSKSNAQHHAREQARAYIADSKREPFVPTAAPYVPTPEAIEAERRVQEIRGKLHHVRAEIARRDSELRAGYGLPPA